MPMLLEIIIVKLIKVKVVFNYESAFFEFFVHFLRHCEEGVNGSVKIHCSNTDSVVNSVMFVYLCERERVNV